MKRFIETIRNIYRIEELRKRIATTLILLLVYRLGTFIILPGIDSEQLEGFAASANDNILGLFNIFAGGAFGRGAIFALGIMPYISASIFMQLLTLAVPAFQRMQKDGENGRRQINQYTRYLTIAFTALQAVGYLNSLGNDPSTQGAFLYNTNPAAMTKEWFMISNIILLVCGTMFTMWLGERITDRGLGNGTSLIIMVGIIARLPNALFSEMIFKLDGGALFMFIIEMIAWFGVVLAVILITQGTRKIPVNYAKRIIGNRQYGAPRQYIPLKIIGAGVMPIIFAQALMFLPPAIGSLYGAEGPPKWVNSISDPHSLIHNIVFAVMIIAFTYFYTAIIFNAQSMADEMKKNNGFIPGIKPGKSTSNFIDDVLSKITLPGALFIAAVAVLPTFAFLFGVQQEFSQFYGGTSLLILVGVVLDTLQQIENYLLMRHYDGLMKSGRIKGRSGAMQTQQAY